MAGGKKTYNQCMGDGNGNIQIGMLVVQRCHPTTPEPVRVTLREDQEPMSLEKHGEIADIVLEIEMAEEHLMDAATIWKALTRHLNGRGLAESYLDGDTLTRGQYWDARTYLTNWLTCRLGENLPRSTMLRQIPRMWEICPGLRLSTQALCRTRFRSDELDALNDVQLRAALWMTIADWQTFWANR